MVHSMLFTNCVKEQCYWEEEAGETEEEEENPGWQVQIHAQASTHTQIYTTGLDRVRYKRSTVSRDKLLLVFATGG